MVKDYSSKKKSRLTRLEEKRNKKHAFLFTFLTIVLIIVLFFLGIPALIRFVVFIGDIRSSGKAPEIIDTIPPSTPVLQALPEATSSSKIKVKGYASAGSNVRLIVNGETKKELLVGNNGDFIFDGIVLKSGENKIKARAFDDAGNKSPLSETLTIEYDNEKPELEISFPEEGQEFFDKDKNITVEGKTDPDIKVYINGKLNFADYEGRFSANVELNEGENIITVKAVDKAENQQEIQIKINYSP
jgi:hypothetical protein